MKCHTFTTLLTHKMHEFRLIFDVLFLQTLFVNLGSKQEMACAFSFLRTCLLRYRKLLFQALFSLHCLYLSLGEAVITVLAEDLGMSVMEPAPGVFIQPMLSCPVCCLNLTMPHITEIGCWLTRTVFLVIHPHYQLPAEHPNSVLESSLVCAAPKYASAVC